MMIGSRIEWAGVLMTFANQSEASATPLQAVLFWIGLCWISWEGMQILHESGHVLGAVGTGGRVVHVELRPWQISRTDVVPNPSPLIVVWSGPIAGIAFPFGMWLVTRIVWRKIAAPFQFFAGFCLIANGAYLGSAFSEPIGDAADLLRNGAVRWQLLAFAVITIPLGIWLWDGLTKQMGIGRAAVPIPRSWCWGIWCWLVPLLCVLSIR